VISKHAEFLCLEDYQCCC